MLPRRRGKPRSGAVGPAAMQWGTGNPGQEGQGESPSSQQPLLWWESLWWDRHRSLAPVLLPLGDERLSLPRLGVGAWVTEAALYPLRAGAVTWPRGEDIVGAWGRGLLGP